jgi:hypothetical protein
MLHPSFVEASRLKMAPAAWTRYGYLALPTWPSTVLDRAHPRYIAY